ncbi:hypothetical protein U27_06549 [Candidatus Vecturithrix granuli]|uniref:Uncharacterized protein n=1 Tax=Vecturithrix granuli TaxID=1499967 RepID=A0A081C4Q9_VECG1|nr:hypothetical protein U27_06549 [Candidatus Vecturithrix granuli]
MHLFLIHEFDSGEIPLERVESPMDFPSQEEIPSDTH